MIPPVPPKVYQPNPDDHLTPATYGWAALITAAALLQAYGGHRDKVEPGNRGKWQLSSNIRWLGGFDSVTGLPVDVPHGQLRRAALIVVTSGLAGWVLPHWTNPRGRF